MPSAVQPFPACEKGRRSVRVPLGELPSSWPSARTSKSFRSGGTSLLASRRWRPWVSTPWSWRLLGFAAWVSTQQTGAFLDFVAEDWLYAMWHLIAFRGLRRGEACGQPWSETNLDTHFLTVSSQLVQDGWEVEASDPKTDSGSRVVAQDDDTVHVLKRHRERQDTPRED